ncbi:TetR/AcrR family transcriptional regulator [Kitasatospora sp. LaBMicrA B282]|uniref:TetR/AcrR family transcriptional regulator n=1 Tax=Kitasatospora sp. LaBMicrA B282 TaxID=3420949 RepID=UPI003D0F2E1D
MRTGSYHHGDLRAALLDRAEQTLREQGVDALSLRELARGLDVSHAAPSRHFKDKRALLDALAFTGIQRLTASCRARLARSGEDFRARVFAFARAYVDFAADHSALLELSFARKHDPVVEEALQLAWQPLEADITALITVGQQAGEIRPGGVDRIAGAVFAAVHGVATQAATGMLQGEALDQVFDDLLTHLLRGLRPAPGDEPLAGAALFRC